MARTFLVTGPTGSTGSNTVKSLLDAGVNVRAFTHQDDERTKALRKLGVEVVIGNILDFDAVRGAVEGVEGAYFVFPIMPGILQASAYFAQAAKEAVWHSGHSPKADSLCGMGALLGRPDQNGRAENAIWHRKTRSDCCG
jgi:uncharacterized protein YbjT (DUF2867 family)